MASSSFLLRKAASAIAARQMYFQQLDSKRSFLESNEVGICRIRRRRASIVRHAVVNRYNMLTSCGGRNHAVVFISLTLRTGFGAIYL